MNKKGFTLIELLAVIVILGIILVIAVPSVISVMSTAKKKTAANEAILALKAYESCISVESSSLNCSDLNTFKKYYEDINNIIVIKGNNSKITQFEFESNSGYYIIFKDAGGQNINDLKTKIDNQDINIISKREYNKQNNIPIGYQEVEYIEGRGTEYILTNYIPNNDDTIECASAKSANSVNSVAIYGVLSNPTATNSFSLGYSVNAGSWHSRWGNVDGNFDFKAKPDVKNITIQNKNGITTNGKLFPYPSISTQTDAIDYLSLFRSNHYNDSACLIGKIYYFKVIRNNNYIYNLIPCYRKLDNVIGMYDNINNVFYTNSGTGNFIVGDDV